MPQIVRTNAKTRTLLHRATKRAGAVIVVGNTATGYAIGTRYDFDDSPIALLTAKKIKTRKAAIAKAIALFGRSPAVLKGTPLPA